MPLPASTSVQPSSIIQQVPQQTVVPAIVAATTPQVSQGYAVVSVAGGYRVANTAGLAVNPIAAGIATNTASEGQALFVSVAGVVPNAVTHLGNGVASAVGIDVNGKLVRAADPTIVSGFYVGDCNTAGDLTIRIRYTSTVSDYQLAAWAQQVFHFANASVSGRPVGKNTNDGLTASTALLDNAEYIRRTGTVRDIIPSAPDVVLSHHTDYDQTDPLVQVVNVRCNGGLQIFPLDLTVTRTGTLASFTADNPATGQLHQIADVSGVVTFPAGSLVRYPSGPRSMAGATSRANTCNGHYIAKDLGGGVARMQVPLYSTSGDYFNLFEFAPVAGNTYEIVQPRKLTLGLRAGACASPTTRNVFDIAYISPQRAAFGGQTVGTLLPGLAAQHAWCDFGYTVAADAMPLAHGCHITGVFALTNGKFMGYHNLFRATAYLGLAGEIVLNGKTLFQGCGTWDTNGFGKAIIHHHSSSGWTACFDSTATVFQLQNNAEMELRGSFFGANNAGMAIDCIAGHITNNLSAFNFKCASNTEGTYPGGVGYDFRIGAKTTLPPLNTATWAYNPAEIACTYAALIAAYGGGVGFSGSMIDPLTSLGISKGS